jgi:hypothetical protein
MYYIWFRRIGESAPASDDRAQGGRVGRQLPIREYMRTLPEAAGLLDQGDSQGASAGRHQREGVPSQLRHQQSPNHVLSFSPEAGTWWDTGVQNVPRSAWVKTDVASQQMSRLPFCWQRRFLPTRCEVHSAPPLPPQVPTSGSVANYCKYVYMVMVVLQCFRKLSNSIYVVKRFLFAHLSLCNALRDAAR